MNTTNRRVLTIKEAAKLIDGLTEYRIRGSNRIITAIISLTAITS